MRSRRARERSITRTNGLFWAFLIFSFAGCSARGCLPQEHVTILYQGETLLEPGAEVILGADPVGVITEVQARPGGQRVTVTLREAAVLSRGDRFLPFRTPRGVGLKVIDGAGDPLHDGDIIDGSFAVPARREPLQPQPAQPANAEKPEVPPAQWSSAPPKDDVAQAGIVPSRFTRIPPAVARLPVEIAARARALPPGEAVMYLTGEHESLRRTLQDEERAARERNDRQAVAELRELRIKTMGMIVRLRAQAAQLR